MTKAEMKAWVAWMRGGRWWMRSEGGGAHLEVVRKGEGWRIGKMSAGPFSHYCLLVGREVE